jgi:hypothetical protein
MEEMKWSSSGMFGVLAANNLGSGYCLDVATPTAFSRLTLMLHIGHNGGTVILHFAPN